MKCIISCEHASNRIPPHFAYLFDGKDNVKSSHRAYDAGAASLARRLAKRLNGSLHLGSISRLLIDLNRSQTNRRSLFSQYSGKLKKRDREMLLKKYHFPYRKRVEEEVGRIIAQGRPALHISIHSFCPVKDSKVRKADIGLLYDPARKSEKKICVLLGRFLHKEIMSLQVRRNYPYLGKSDGFTAFLRKQYTAEHYAGIEIEMNQGLLLSQRNRKEKVIETLIKGITIIDEKYFFENGIRWGES